MIYTAKETGNPDAIGPFVVVVRIKKGFEPLLDFVGQYVFFNL